METLRILIALLRSWVGFQDVISGGVKLADHYDIQNVDGKYMHTITLGAKHIRAFMDESEITKLLFINEGHDTEVFVPKSREHEWFLFRQEYGESTEEFYRVPIEQANVQADEIMSIMRVNGLETNGEHCTHEHDCCGHWYRGGARIIHRGPDFAIVSIDYWVNV